MYLCYFCNNSFTHKNNLNRHLKERCKSQLKDDLLNDIVKLNSILVKTINKTENVEIVDNELTINGDNNTGIIGNNNSNNTVNIEININPINKLNTDYIRTDKMMQFIEKCHGNEIDNNSLNLFFIIL